MVPKDNTGWYQRTARGGTKGQHGVVPKDSMGWYQRTARGGTKGQQGVVLKTGQRGVVPKREDTTLPRTATRNTCGTGVEATVGKSRCVKQTAFKEKRKKERKARDVYYVLCFSVVQSLMLGPQT